MKVKEAQVIVEEINNEIKNLHKLLRLSEEDKRRIEEKADLNNSLNNTINICIKTMGTYKNVLEEKIADAEI